MGNLFKRRPIFEKTTIRSIHLRSLTSQMFPYSVPPFVFQPEQIKVIFIRNAITCSEDLRLKCPVTKSSDSNWRTIEPAMGNCTGRQCRDRYKDYPDPQMVNGPATKEEISFSSKLLPK
jgi:hypothetical protein